MNKILTPVFLFAACCGSVGSVHAQPIVIDHQCTAIEEIPDSYIEKARGMFRVAYGHTSHGSQIVSGMQALRQEQPEKFSFGPEAGSGLLLLDRTPKGDLGNPDRVTWEQRTRELLENNTRNINVVVWSWCGQAGSATENNIQQYLDLMSALERDYPNIQFVYMTGHLDGSGKEGNLNRSNEQIRQFCRTQGKILFDFADIESYDPDGKTNYMELNANDKCDYKEDGRTRNWAVEWIEKNPDHGMALPERAAHTQPLNGALKGRAFWWMMARLAGWDGGQKQ